MFSIKKSVSAQKRIKYSYNFSDYSAERAITSTLGELRSIRLTARKNKNKQVKENRRISVPASSRQSEDTHKPHYIPAAIPLSDPGDTIDLSKIGDDSSFEIAVDDVKPSRLRVDPDELLKNSIDRFDAFGDYEYIGKY